MVNICKVNTPLHYGVLFLIIFLFAGCSKFLDVPQPIDQLTGSSVFSDSASASSAVIGLYARQVTSYFGGFLNGNTSILPALTSDEVYPGVLTGSDYEEFAINAIKTTNYSSQSNWSNAYNVIYQANSNIEHLNSSTSLSESVKKTFIGETKFIRAINYFYLTCEYGTVPLAVTSDYLVNGSLPGSDSSTIYNQVISDLKDAQAALTVTYPGPEKDRANKWAATALLARVYLYQQNWTEAAAEATAIIDDGTYPLSDISETFVPNNSEAILQFVPAIKLSIDTYEGYLFNPPTTTSIPGYPLRDGLVSAFENGDQRKISWVGSNMVDNVIYYYPNKYKTNANPPGNPRTEYNIVLRSAELYLIRAEALAHQGDLVGSIGDLDMVRSRAGLPLIATTNPSISQEALLNQIYHENQIEFFAEWGHRWFDLKRTGTADAVLSVVKGATWQPEDVLFPIPESDILKDPFLKQNPGY